MRPYIRQDDDPPRPNWDRIIGLAVILSAPVLWWAVQFVARQLAPWGPQ